MAKIVLASGSPRRQELLVRMGISDFDIRVPEVEERYPEGLSPEETVCYISREKSDAARLLCGPEEIIITADTMVFLDEKRLGKPKNEDEALAMLTALAGRQHTVCTGVTVRQGERSSPPPSTRMCISTRPRKASSAPISAPASLWTRPEPTAYRARALCWWSGSTEISSMSWVCPFPFCQIS